MHNFVLAVLDYATGQDEAATSGIEDEFIWAVRRAKDQGVPLELDAIIGPPVLVYD